MELKIPSRVHKKTQGNLKEGGTIPEAGSKSVGLEEKWAAKQVLLVTWIRLLGDLFTFYHGKLPLNHHLGKYSLLFSKELKQIQVYDLLIYGIFLGLLYPPVHSGKIVISILLKDLL